MAEVRPFRGILYNGDNIGGEYGKVMAPPYDVISDSMREELYSKSDYGIIRLILGKDAEGDNGGNNKYVRAREFLYEWEKNKVLARDEKASFYVYRQQYDVNNEKRTRIGFIGLMKINDKDCPLPHEHTLAKPKEDRMNLISEVKSNLSPIFTLYEDLSGKVNSVLRRTSENTPVIDIDIDGVSHTLWRISDDSAVNDIISSMEGKKTFIADGHHRYEVARTYRARREQDGNYDGSADYVMVYFTDISERDNLTVLATHRSVKHTGIKCEEALSKLGEYFDITECPSLRDLTEKLEKGMDEEHLFGIIWPDRYIFIKPKDVKALRDLISEDRSEEWKSLDVSVLHSAVFDKILSFDKKEGNITYVKCPEEALSLVENGTHEVSFLLNPTRVGQMKAVAELGEMMPQKSTYFYPKLLTGLVINKFD